MATDYRIKGRGLIITGPRIPEYVDRAQMILRDVSAHLEKAQAKARPNGNGDKAK